MPFKQFIPTSFIMLLALLTLLLASGAHTAQADYYKYTDKDGTPCISNDINSVPKQYRASMKVIREETEVKKEKATKPQTVNSPPPVSAVPETAKPVVKEEPAAPQSPYGKYSARFPWLTPIFLVGAAVILFIVVGKVAELMPSPMLAKIIYLTFFLGVFVFGYKSYAEHLLANYTSIKSKVMTMFEKSNRRELPLKDEMLPPVPAKEE